MLQRNWSTLDGLPENSVAAMACTRDGYLWLGTDTGLARFDGVRFKIFGLQDGLGAIAVQSLLVARDGTLWVGTVGGGVSTLRDSKVERTIKLGVPSATIFSLAEDAEGHLWAGGRTGFARLENDHFAPVPEAPNGGKGLVRALYCDRHGVMWVALAAGPVWQWSSGHWTSAGDNGPREGTAFAEDSTGRLWIATADHRLWWKEGEAWQSRAFPEAFHAPVESMAAAPDGVLWLSFYREGLCGLRNGQFIMPKIRSEKFLDQGQRLLISPEGQIFLGTSTEGLYALTRSRLTMATLDTAGSTRGANIIGGLAEFAPGEFLVGTQGRGFHVWSARHSSSLDPDPALTPNLIVNSLHRARDGGVWAATGKGLFLFREGHRVPWSESDAAFGNVWDICDDVSDGLWIGMGNGKLIQFVQGKTRELAYGSTGVSIKGLAQEANGTLWVGTRGNGLYGGQANTWRRFGRDQGLLSEVIRVVHIAPDGAVWVGTAGGGLAVLRGDSTTGGFVSITTRQGLPDDTVSQITTDDEGRLWVGTHRGVAVFSAQEAARMRTGDVSHFCPVLIDHHEGLYSEECTVVPPLRTSSGQFAIGTLNGFALLRPSDFQVDEKTPPVLIETLLADGKPVHAAQGRVVLSPGLDRLEIQFTGFHFIAPERLRFRSRLTPLESEWGEASSQRSVEYRNLAPGSYRFETSATTGNGKWSAQPARLEIRLLPHFWQTTWFRVAVAALVLGLVAFVARQRERKRGQRKIEALERQQAVDAERARIARDLHDDVGASLTQVALLSELVNRNITTRPERASQQAGEIFTTAQNMTRALDEIVWAVDPAHDTLECFALFLATFVQNYAHAAGLQTRLDFPEKLPAAPLPSPVRHHLYLATKEVLHNIVKHAAATEVRVSLKIDQRRLKLTIEDNGRGFDDNAPATDPGAMGLGNLQQRLMQIGGSYHRRSAPNCGAFAEMQVPLEIDLREYWYVQP